MSKLVFAKNRRKRHELPAVGLLEPRTLLSSTTFVIDPALTTLTVSGSVGSGVIPLQIVPQSHGSLTDQFTGSIQADVLAGSISFPGGSAVVAEQTHNYLPGTDDGVGMGDHALAAFGGALSFLNTTEYIAARNLAFDVFSNGPLTVDSGLFAASATQLESVQGVIYEGGFTPAVTNLAGLVGDNSGTTGTLTTANGVETLTLPVAAVYAGVSDNLSYSLTYTGQIVATAPVAVAGVSITKPAYVDSAVVTGKTTGLHVLATDPSDPSSLKYTWAVASSSPGPVSFSVNGTNASQNTIVTFTKPGNYMFRVTVADATGNSATSSVSVRVDATPTSISVSPSSAYIVPGKTVQFTAVAVDQFANAIPSVKSFSWKVTSGKISPTGMFTASATAGGPNAVTASSGTVKGVATVTVVKSPTIAKAASASPATVTGKTATLSVLGSDTAGESSLIYSWTLTGAPPGAVKFSSNGKNASKSTFATFAAAGTYKFSVTITDGHGFSIVSAVTISVEQVLTSLAITASENSIAASKTKQLKIVGYDQFVKAIPTLPAVTWSTNLGKVSSKGLYAAPEKPGTATVTAMVGKLISSTTITVTFI